MDVCAQQRKPDSHTYIRDASKVGQRTPCFFLSLSRSVLSSPIFIASPSLWPATSRLDAAPKVTQRITITIVNDWNQHADIPCIRTTLFPHRPHATSTLSRPVAQHHHWLKVHSDTQTPVSLSPTDRLSTFQDKISVVLLLWAASC